MAVVPVGSFVFTLGGNAATVFTDTSGNVLTGPSGLWPGQSGTYFRSVIQLPNGNYGCRVQQSGGSNYSFEVYDSTWASIGGWTSGYFASGLCGNFSDAWYAVANGAASARTIRKLNASGVVTTWVISSVFTGTNVNDASMAVSPDETIAYFGTSSGGGTGIKRWDLVNDVALSDLVAQSGNGPCTDNGIIVLQDGTIVVGWSNGSLVRYSTAGAVLNTYAVTGQAGTPFYQLAISDAATQFNVWYYYGSTSTIRVVQYRASDGVELNAFTASAGASYMDNGFGEVLVGIAAPAPTTPTPTLVNSNACCGDTVTPGAGTAAGPLLPGTGWTPQCTGGGAVESATDLTDSQDWDTLSERQADVWFELELAKYPATEGTTTYRWAKTPFADASAFKEGRLISFGKVKRAASTVDGDYTVGGFSVLLDDSDGLLRTLLEQETTTEYFLNREGGLYVLSPAGRAAGLTKRVLSRGWVSNIQTLKGRQVRIDVSDVVGSQFSGFNLEKTIPTVLLDDIAVSGQLVDALKGKVLPIYAGELSDDGAVDVNGDPAARGLVPAFDIGAIDITDPDNTDAPVSTAPTPPVITASSVTGATGQETRCYGATLITPYGESLMSNIVTCNGASVRNVSNYNEISGTFDGGVGDVNKVRIWYGPTADNMVGWLDEADYNGSGVFGYFDGAAAWPTATRDEIDVVKYMDAPATPPDNNWHIMAVCLGYGYEFLNFYASNLADGTSPVRAEVDAGLHGVQIIGPDDAEWPFANPWIERNGIRFTGYLSTGPLLNHHQQGVITQAVNICGPHDDANLLINQAFRQLLWMLNEHVAKNGGTGYRTGAYWPLETYANGDALFQTTKFEDAQDVSAGYLGTALGYLGMIALTEPITVREFVRRFCLTFGCRLAHNHFGQVFPFLVDAPADATAGRALREHIEIVDIGDPELAHDEILNRQVYSYHVDPEGGENPYRNAGLIAEDLTSIAAHTPGGVSGGADRRGVKQGDDREMAYTNDEATADDVVARELARRSRRPRYLPVTVDLMGLEQEIGDQVRVTHREGLGSGGDVLMPAMVLAHETDADSLNVTLTVQDLRTLPSAAFELMRADDNGALLVADDDGAVLVAD